MPPHETDPNADFLRLISGRAPTAAETERFKTIREPTARGLRYRPRTPRGRKKFWNEVERRTLRNNKRLLRSLRSAIPNASPDILEVYRLWRTQEAASEFTQTKLKETSIMERMLSDA